jgi:hypothetical protein
MRRVSVILASVLFASALAGCPLLKKKGDDSLDAGTVSVPGTGAKNEKDVLRYPTEEAIDEVAVIGKDGAKVRNFPGNGPEVASLAKGTVVKKMAKYFSTGVLVMFDDPATSDGSKLMGWVPPNAFDIAAPKPVWTAPRITDAGAKAATVDSGAGAAKPDAGGGSALVVVDAGGGGGGASGGIPQPKPGTVAVQPVGGKCPDNWALDSAMCRRVCRADTDCPRGIKCKAGASSKVCTSD